MQSSNNQMLDRLCTACQLNAADKWGLSALDYCTQREDTVKCELLVRNGAHMDRILLLHTKCRRCAHQHALGEVPSSCPCQLKTRRRVRACTPSLSQRAGDNGSKTKSTVPSLDGTQSHDRSLDASVTSSSAAFVPQSACSTLIWHTGEPQMSKGWQGAA